MERLCTGTSQVLRHIFMGDQSRESQRESASKQTTAILLHEHALSTKRKRRQTIKLLKRGSNTWRSYSRPDKELMYEEQQLHINDTPQTDKPTVTVTLIEQQQLRLESSPHFTSAQLQAIINCDHQTVSANYTEGPISLT